MTAKALSYVLIWQGDAFSACAQLLCVSKVSKLIGAGRPFWSST